MTIEGDDELFAHLETAYLGVLARRTRIATNARAIVDAAAGKGVRLDPSGTLVDRSIVPMMGTFPPTGVNPQLVANVRNALDAEGIRAFEQHRVLVDAYAVGSAFFQGSGSYDFTADIVAIDYGDGMRPCRKVGRPERPNRVRERVF